MPELTAESRNPQVRCSIRVKRDWSFNTSLVSESKTTQLRQIFSTIFLIQVANFNIIELEHIIFSNYIM